MLTKAEALEEVARLRAIIDLQNQIMANQATALAQPPREATTTEDPKNLMIWNAHMQALKGESDADQEANEERAATAAANSPFRRHLEVYEDGLSMEQLAARAIAFNREHGLNDDGSLKPEPEEAE